MDKKDTEIRAQQLEREGWETERKKLEEKVVRLQCVVQEQLEACQVCGGRNEQRLQGKESTCGRKEETARSLTRVRV